MSGESKNWLTRTLHHAEVGHGTHSSDRRQQRVTERAIRPLPTPFANLIGTKDNLRHAHKLLEQLIQNYLQSWAVFQRERRLLELR
ncbi:MAG: hypothetical protein E5X51_04215 [Mesorhizobium sp.]|uniref:hypothetical protein n=1 Tax=Mesorhizobium sp. TaxID=1871066 RepID=UPI00122BB47B|nr:hypothetical protein [Mesorhizobium sp.]TIQ22871.1 MAG: hypothetical protein E5X51_04215 [Mesorhizobium sp.]